MKKILLSLSLIMAISTSGFAAATASNSNSTGHTPDMSYQQLSNSLTGSDGAVEAMKHPMSENLIGSTAWSLILSELEITLHVEKCGPLFGLKAHMIEPIGYVERVKQPLNFPFVGISIKANPIKTAALYESGGNTGGDSVRSQTANSHFIYTPILGLIMKKKMIFWCLHNGPILLPYLSEFDPSYREDFMYIKMVPQMIAMLSPDVLLSGIIDCIATETSAALYGMTAEIPSDHSIGAYNSYDFQGTAMANGKNNQGTINKIKGETRSFTDMVRDSMYFIDGCNGFQEMGGYEDGNDVITDTYADWNQMSLFLRGISAMSQTSFLDKQTNITFNDPKGGDSPTIVNTMCGPKEFPMPIPSENVLQEAYPVVGGPHEVGETGIAVSTAKNRPASEGTVLILWDRRDYAAFAYNCPGEETRNKD